MPRWLLQPLLVPIWRGVSCRQRHPRRAQQARRPSLHDVRTLLNCLIVLRGSCVILTSKFGWRRFMFFER